VQSADASGGDTTGRVLALGLLVAPALGIFTGVLVYLGGRAVFQGGSYVPDSRWESAGGLAGLTVTALISVVVVRHYRVAPPWRMLVLVGSLAAIPVLVVLYAWATLIPAYGLTLVALLLLTTAVWVSGVVAGRDR
jgi:hypothetical protein